MTQTAIDATVSNINLAMTALNQSIATMAAAQTALENSSSNYKQVNSNFVLRNAGSSSQTIQAQAALVASYRAEAAKDQMVSPIDGIVTRIDPNVGEFVSPGKTAASVISEGVYKIEAYVPEADIAKIVVGNAAEITLDAYGSGIIFKASIVSIDPAETVLEGVPTYKVTLHFSEPDQRIRSGMTANIDILGNEKKNVLVVPSRAVVIENTSRFVRVLLSDGKIYDTVPVTIGLKGSNGFTEIISGVSLGQKVVTYVSR
jgi:RND family efflux transporter MFP subunit